MGPLEAKGPALGGWEVFNLADPGPRCYATDRAASKAGGCTALPHGYPFSLLACVMYVCNDLCTDLLPVGDEGL